MQLDAFDKAEFYSYDDGDERLSMIEPSDAIERYLDGYCVPEPGCGYFNYPESLTIYAWDRKPISEKQRKRFAGDLAEALTDRYHDSDDSDPESTEIPMSDENWKIVQDKLREAVEHFANSLTVWACEIVAQRTYTEAEMRELMEDPKQPETAA